MEKHNSTIDILKWTTFGDPAVEAIYNEQGVKEVKYFGGLDKELVFTMYKVLHITGGQAQGSGENHRVSVSAMAETDVQIMVYFIHNRKRFSRPYLYNNVILDNIRKLNFQCDMKKSHQGTEAITTVNSKDWPKDLEADEECIHELQGVDNFPIKYVLSTNIKHKTAGDNQEGGEAASQHLTHDKEMVSHTTIVESNTMGTEKSWKITAHSQHLM